MCNCAMFMDYRIYIIIVYKWTVCEVLVETNIRRMKNHSNPFKNRISPFVCSLFRWCWCCRTMPAKVHHVNYDHEKFLDLNGIMGYYSPTLHYICLGYFKLWCQQSILRFPDFNFRRLFLLFLNPFIGDCIYERAFDVSSAIWLSLRINSSRVRTFLCPFALTLDWLWAGWKCPVEAQRYNVDLYFVDKRPRPYSCCHEKRQIERVAARF